MVSIPWVEGRTGGSASAPGVATSRKVRAREPQSRNEGVVGAERLVSVEFDDGEVLEYRGKRGVELLWALWMPTGLLPWLRRCRRVVPRVVRT